MNSFKLLSGTIDKSIIASYKFSTLQLKNFLGSYFEIIGSISFFVHWYISFSDFYNFLYAFNNEIIKNLWFLGSFKSLFSYFFDKIGKNVFGFISTPKSTL